MIIESRPLIARQCSLQRVHPPHKWWSRKQRCYFHCHGHKVPGLRPPKRAEA